MSNQQIEKYRQDLIADVTIRAEANGVEEVIQFLDTVTSDLSESYTCPNAEPCYFDRIGRRNRRLKLHGWNFDEEFGTMSLFYCDFDGSDSFPEPLTQTDFKKYIGNMIAFAEDALSKDIENSVEISDEGYELARLIRKQNNEIDRYALYVITDRQKSSRFKTLDEYIIEGKEATAQLIDIERCYYTLVRQDESVELEVDFKELSGGEIDGISYINASSDVAEYEAFLCVMPGTILSKIYQRYGSLLLSSNVRSFLTAKGEVNKGIRDTIRNEPDKFFAYNNGITTTASEVVIKNNKIIRISDFKIVNGGQTTVSVFNETKTTFADRLGRVFIPMKLTKVNKDLAKELVPNISKYANSQNAIKKSDLDSNSEFQMRMESFSRSVRIPQTSLSTGNKKWYYERTRGQWEQDRNAKGIEERKKFDKEYGRRVDKIEFSKLRLMIEMQPHVVARGGQTCYIYYSKEIAKGWAEQSEKYSEDYYRDTISTAILHNEAYAAIKNCSWFSGHYRAQVAYYSLSKLFYMAEQIGRPIDMAAIWKEQTVPKPLVEQLMKIGEVFFEYLRARMGAGENGGQWCKKQECWEDVKGMGVQFSEEAKKYTISVSEQEKRVAAGAELRKTQDSYNDYNAVKAHKIDHWIRMKRWCDNNISLGLKDQKLLENASKGRELNAKQCTDLLALEQMIKDQGYSED